MKRYTEITRLTDDEAEAFIEELTAAEAEDQVIMVNQYDAGDEQQAHLVSADELHIYRDEDHIAIGNHVVVSNPVLRYAAIYRDEFHPMPELDTNQLYRLNDQLTQILSELDWHCQDDDDDDALNELTHSVASQISEMISKTRR